MASAISRSSFLLAMATDGCHGNAARPESDQEGGRSQQRENTDGNAPSSSGDLRPLEPLDERLRLRLAPGGDVLRDRLALVRLDPVLDLGLRDDALLPEHLEAHWELVHDVELPARERELGDERREHLVLLREVREHLHPLLRHGDELRALDAVGDTAPHEAHGVRVADVALGLDVHDGLDHLLGRRRRHLPHDVGERGDGVGGGELLGGGGDLGLAGARGRGGHRRGYGLGVGGRGVRLGVARRACTGVGGRLGGLLRRLLRLLLLQRRVHLAHELVDLLRGRHLGVLTARPARHEQLLVLALLLHVRLRLGVPALLAQDDALDELVHEGLHVLLRAVAHDEELVVRLEERRLRAELVAEVLVEQLRRALQLLAHVADVWEDGLGAVAAGLVLDEQLGHLVAVEHVVLLERVDVEDLRGHDGH
mmetsp:Transcript_20417/g.63463  ORF Transcript_20417/g.63463 Transcript_20417/m.63463 type:complete len:424 (-) Transcript_20417:114-1385(-)